MSTSIVRTLRRWLGLSLVAGLLFGAFATGAVAIGAGLPGDLPHLRPGAKPLPLSEESEQQLLRLDAEQTSLKTAGDVPLTLQQVAGLRRDAHAAAIRIKHKRLGGDGPHVFDTSWTQAGPDPILQLGRSDYAYVPVSGRIGALAFGPGGRFILGAAQGGIWTSDDGGTTWIPRTDDQSSLAIGALAVAPSDNNVVYAGTGEGALSGDSMFGNGVLRSDDGGTTWSHVSGDYFVGVSISRIVVDPTNPDHLYAAVLHGRGGARRVGPPIHSRYGIWESSDGGATWTLLKEVPDANGATDLEIDPQNPNILYASFWGDAIYKSTDAGQTWNPIMNGLPTNADYSAGPTRFSLSISHPAGTEDAVLYVGFDWYDTSGGYHPGSIYKSTDGGASWSPTGTGSGADSVVDYCGTQCWYDNVIEVDPTNPDVVYAGGSYGYDLSPQSGGLFRSTDGGATWENLGWDLHPDFHALAMDPSNPDHVLVGNDGGVWYSPDQGGRPSVSDSLDSVDWQDLNGGGLVIGQFTSVATNPTLPTRLWGGTQDNGTLAQYGSLWADLAGGDGGQVLVDPTDYHYVYGEYYGISPFRYTDGGTSFYTNQYIANGINPNDRSEFYVPMAMNQLDPSQLFLGTYRLYRTDNAKAPSAGDVQWKTISGDLTSGCTGPAPNGARTCAISAIGVGGGTAAYVGTLDGLVWVSPNAQTSDNPTWIRVDSRASRLPDRPVAWFAVDRSNYRIAYVAFNGYDAATPRQPGHVFKTVNGGMRWENISGNLPDVPVNSIALDPSYPNTLYAATDVGTFVTYNGGGYWVQLGGSSMPTVSGWQIDLDPLHRVLAVGTHGRGVFTMADPSKPVPSLVVSTVDAGVPVGPSSDLSYTLTVQNIGNGDATGVAISDPLPRYTSFVSADHGGTFSRHGGVSWSGLSIPSGGSVSVHLTVQINPRLSMHTSSIVDDGVRVASAQGPYTTGSPVITPIAPAHAMGLTPASQTDGGRAGSSVTYHVAVTNDGYMSDSYTMSSTGGTYAVSFYASDCSTPLTTTATVAPGASADVCVQVAVPPAAADGDTSTSTVTATSVGSTSLSASGSITTIAVTKSTLLVDEDGNFPDVQSYYTAALDANSVDYSVWDLAADPNLPQGYLDAHTNVIWFTGNSYPGPITPYEAELKSFLDGGGRLFMSGQDILDQSAGTTSFVHDYLHIYWDGSETQNDKATATVTGVGGNPVTDGIGTIPLDHSVLGAYYEDEVTPINGAQAAFMDDGVANGVGPAPDALTYDGGAGSYKVVFLGFPMEAYGTATDKADLIGRVMTFFGS